MTVDEFLDTYVSRHSRVDAEKRLGELLDKRLEEAEASEIFAPTQGEILDIGEDADIGFYVVTGSEREALSKARKYMTEDMGLDRDIMEDTLNNAQKMKLHLYTKPWEKGIYADWNWFAEYSDHKKAKWAFKFKF